MRSFDCEPCDPPIGPISFADDEHPTITTRLQARFAADQAARQSSALDWGNILVEDSHRRPETLLSLRAGQGGAPVAL
jgi:hypothetical protein